MQVEGVGMGNQLSCIFADIFMHKFERELLDSCLSMFKPLFYRRYVDDAFVLFKDSYHCDQFLQYPNSLHNNIKFTNELLENNNQLSFWDTIIIRDDNRSHTGVFRKKIFTGLGQNFYSSCFYHFKLNSLATLLNRPSFSQRRRFSLWLF